MSDKITLCTSGNIALCDNGNIKRCSDTEEDAYCIYMDDTEGPQALAINGYSDGDIPVSACTSAVSSSNSAWEGTFSNRTTPCSWETTPLPTDKSINGMFFVSGYVSFFISQWELYMNLKDINDNLITLWYGKKLTGLTPMGMYEFESGCAGGPATLEIIEVVS